MLIVQHGKVLHCGNADQTLLDYGRYLRVKDCSKYLIMPGQHLFDEDGYASSFTAEFVEPPISTQAAAGMIDCHVHFPQIDMIGSYGEQLLDWLTK